MPVIRVGACDQSSGELSDIDIPKPELLPVISTDIEGSHLNFVSPPPLLQQAADVDHCGPPIFPNFNNLFNNQIKQEAESETSSYQSISDTTESMTSYDDTKSTAIRDSISFSNFTNSVVSNGASAIIIDTDEVKTEETDSDVLARLLFDYNASFSDNMVHDNTPGTRRSARKKFPRRYFEEPDDEARERSRRYRERQKRRDPEGFLEKQRLSARRTRATRSAEKLAEDRARECQRVRLSRELRRLQDPEGFLEEQRIKAKKTRAKRSAEKLAEDRARECQRVRLSRELRRLQDPEGFLEEQRIKAKKTRAKRSAEKLADDRTRECERMRRKRRRLKQLDPDGYKLYLERQRNYTRQRRKKQKPVDLENCKHYRQGNEILSNTTDYRNMQNTLGNPIFDKKKRKRCVRKTVPYIQHQRELYNWKYAENSAFLERQKLQRRAIRYCKRAAEFIRKQAYRIRNSFFQKLIAESIESVISVSDTK